MHRRAIHLYYLLILSLSAQKEELRILLPPPPRLEFGSKSTTLLIVDGATQRRTLAMQRFNFAKTNHRLPFWLTNTTSHSSHKITSRGVTDDTHEILLRESANVRVVGYKTPFLVRTPLLLSERFRSLFLATANGSQHCERKRIIVVLLDMSWMIGIKIERH